MFKNRMFLAVAGGHFIVDVLNSTGAVLLAVLSVPLGLSNQQIGTALTIYLLIGSLSQPLFGWIADKLPGRAMLLGAISVGWMGLFFSLVALAPTWAMLLPVFLLAPLGSGLFHPIGAATAGAAVPERAASATSVFFFFGQVGLALGPFLAGALAGRFGAIGIIPMALAALLPTGLLLAARSDERRLVRRAKGGPARAPISWSAGAIALVAAFVLLVAVRSSLQATFQAFLPKLFSDRGWDPALFGLLAGVFMGAGAVGQVLTGNMADRFGMRAAVVLPLLLSVPAGMALLLVPATWVIFLACAAAGLLVGGQHSVLVVHAQRLLPVKQGLAAGLILGFTFASGAIGTWVAGLLADGAGLQNVLIGVVFLALPCALLALTLPGRRARPAPAPAPQPAGD